MKTEKITAYAEIIGAAAIVISLMFVGLQLRQSNSLNKSAAYTQLMTNLNQVFIPVYEEENLSNLWRAFMTGNMDDLNEDDAFRLRILAMSVFRTFDSAYYSYEYNTLGDIEWERIGQSTCTVRRNMNEELWGVTKSLISNDFSEYVDNTCK